MRVRRALARDAPGRAVETVSTLRRTIFQTGKRSGQNASGRRRPTFSVVAKYSTALVRARQHLFFDRQHHARLKSLTHGVVNADRDEKSFFVKQQNVPAVFQPARYFRDADGLSVAQPSRLLDV